MGINIETLAGADLTDMKAVAGALSGWVNVDSGAISTPVTSFDVLLPSGYAKFLLEMEGFKLDAGDTISGAFSKDAGVTFYCDVDNADTYGAIKDTQLVRADNTYSQNRSGSLDNDSLCDFGINVGLALPGEIGYATVIIFPGDASHSLHGYSRARSLAMDAETGQAVFQLRDYCYFLNPMATATPVFGRANLLRICPYGEGDMPPTSGEHITAGSWALFGVPDPA